jgi:hypothetical protein
MNIKITFNTNNAAFEDNGFEYELNYVLNQLKYKWLSNPFDMSLYDSNGNIIGKTEVK